MGFKVKLNMQIADPYTVEVKSQITAALGQFVEQYNANVSACDVQIIPDDETITFVSQEEATQRL
jgi:hypothetical protein